MAGINNKIFIIVGSALAISLCFIVFYNGYKRHKAPDQKFLESANYCQADADCVPSCGSAENKYFIDAHRNKLGQACPAVIVFGAYCQANICQPIYSTDDPHYVAH